MTTQENRAYLTPKYQTHILHFAHRDAWRVMVERKEDGETLTDADIDHPPIQTWEQAGEVAALLKARLQEFDPCENARKILARRRVLQGKED